MKKAPATIPTAEQQTTTLYLRPVPAYIKNNFKSECAKRGISMLDAQTVFMKHSVELLPAVVKLKKQDDRTKAALAV